MVRERRNSPDTRFEGVIAKAINPVIENQSIAIEDDNVAGRSGQTLIDRFYEA